MTVKIGFLIQRWHQVGNKRSRRLVEFQFLVAGKERPDELLRRYTISELKMSKEMWRRVENLAATILALEKMLTEVAEDVKVQKRFDEPLVLR